MVLNIKENLWWKLQLSAHPLSTQINNKSSSGKKRSRGDGLHSHITFLLTSANRGRRRMSGAQKYTLCWGLHNVLKTNYNKYISITAANERKVLTRWTKDESVEEEEGEKWNKKCFHVNCGFALCVAGTKEQKNVRGIMYPNLFLLLVMSTLRRAYFFNNYYNSTSARVSYSIINKFVQQITCVTQVFCSLTRLFFHFLSSLTSSHNFLCRFNNTQNSIFVVVLVSPTLKLKCWKEKKMIYF